MSFKRRLDRLYKSLPDDLVLLCRLSDGSEREMSVDEWAKSDAVFIQVVSGNDLRQLDRLLAHFTELCNEE